MKRSFLLPTFALLAFAGLASAADVTWTPGTTDFNLGTNWSGSVTPGSGDNAFFTGAAGTQPGLTASDTIQGLTFNGTTSSGYTLSSSNGSLTLTNTGTGATSAINAANTSGTNTISAPIILGGAAASTQYFTQAAGGTLSISGNISQTNAITELRLQGAGATSKFVLSGSNSYAGITRIVNGELVLANANALAGSASLWIDNGGIVSTSLSSFTLGFSQLNINFLNNFGSTANTGNFILTGTAYPNQTARIFTVNAGTTVDIQGQLNQSGGTPYGIQKNGTGTMILSGNNTMGAGVVASAGILQLNNANNGGLGASTGTLTLNAFGTVQAINAARTYGGSVLMNGQAHGATISGNQDITFNGTTTATNGGNILYNNMTNGTLTFNGPVNLHNTSGHTGTLTFAGASTGVTVINGVIANGNDQVNGVTFGGGTLAGGKVVLTNSNTYNGTTTVAWGTLSISSDANLNGTSSALTFASDYFTHTAILQITGTTLTSLNTGRTTSFGSNGVGFDIADANNTFTVSQNLNMGGTGTLYKYGAGTLVVSGTSSYTGTTNVTAGTLQLAKTSALYGGNTTSWTAANIKVDSGATLALNVGGSGEFSTGNVTTLITNLDRAVTSNGLKAGSKIAFDTTNAGGNFTVADSIQNTTGTGGGTIGLTKLGTGALTLTGTNPYTGGTTVSVGTLLVNNTSGSGTGTGTVSVSSGATLGGNGTISGATTINGILAPGNSIGTLNITANTTWAGAATAGAATDWKFELGAGNTADLLNITGNLLKDTVAGSAFRFDFAASTATGTFKLIDWSGSTGFSSTDFSYTNLGGGNTGTFAFNGSQLELTVIPEPATWALLALSMTTVMVLRRRRS
jgi:autotransporter-associated beta strand protein